MLPRHPLFEHEGGQEYHPVKDHHAEENEEADPLVDVHDFIIVQNIVSSQGDICFSGWRSPSISSLKLISHKSSECIGVE